MSPAGKVAKRWVVSRIGFAPSLGYLSVVSDPLCRPIRRTVRQYPVAAGLALLVCVCGAARGEIYMSLDEKGLIHITNIPPSRLDPGRTPNRLGFGGALSSPLRYRDMVQDAARQYELKAGLIHAVILTESGYRPDAVSYKGAAGLMQLMPATAQRYGVRNVWDPAQNIQGGAQYLRDLMAMFNNDLPLTLAAYNAGERAVLRHGGIPPYPETARYVTKVLDHYARHGGRLEENPRSPPKTAMHQ